MLNELLTTFAEARQIAKKRAEEQQDARERAAIAKAFNDRYTFRREWVEGKERLPGTSMFGINPRGGFAWMCPECNQIHHPEESSVFSGLQYPECCSHPKGHRLDDGIRIDG